MFKFFRDTAVRNEYVNESFFSRLLLVLKMPILERFEKLDEYHLDSKIAESI